MGVSVNMHIRGKNLPRKSQNIHHQITRKKDAKIFELIILGESLLHLKAIPAFPEKLSV